MIFYSNIGDPKRWDVAQPPGGFNSDTPNQHDLGGAT